MKKYKCNKVVEAVQIKVWRHGWAEDLKGRYVLLPTDFYARDKQPQPGDYLVRYAPDGHMSWSPKAAFEAGYSPVEDDWVADLKAAGFGVVEGAEAVRAKLEELGR